MNWNISVIILLWVNFIMITHLISKKKHSSQWKLNCANFKQAFDSIVGNTVVPYQSLKKFFTCHTPLYIAIYNKFQVEVCICIIATYWHTTFYAPNFDNF